MTNQGENAGNLQRLLANLDEAIEILARTPDYAKATKTNRVLIALRKIMMLEGGPEAIEQRSSLIEAAGIFNGSDWSQPQILQPSLTKYSLRSASSDVVLMETLSEIRLLAVARGTYQHPSISTEQAHHYLTQVLALNLELLFTAPSEAERTQQGSLALLTRRLLNYLVEGIGYEYIVDRLVDEIWRMLQQRPIQVDSVKQMILQIASCRVNPDIELGISGQGADRLISSLFGTTNGCREDPGLDVYQQRLEGMDAAALQYEATGFARAMHDTGLVSPYHAVLLRHLLTISDHTLAEASGFPVRGVTACCVIEHWHTP